MPLRTIAWPAVTEDDATPPNPVGVIVYNVYFDGAPTPTYVVPAPQLSQTHDFPFSTTPVQVGVSAEGPGGEGVRTTVQHTEGSGVPAAPGSVTVT